MRRHVARWQTSTLLVALASSVALTLSGCSTRGGITRSDIDPCPDIVWELLVEADEVCLPEAEHEALSNHCHAIEEQRR